MAVKGTIYPAMNIGPLTGHAHWVVRNVRTFCCSLWDGIFGISDVSLTLLLVTKMYSQSGNKV